MPYRINKWEHLSSELHSTFATAHLYNERCALIALLQLRLTELFEHRIHKETLKHFPTYDDVALHNINQQFKHMTKSHDDNTTCTNNAGPYTTFAQAKTVRCNELITTHDSLARTLHGSSCQSCNVPPRIWSENEITSEESCLTPSMCRWSKIPKTTIYKLVE